MGFCDSCTKLIDGGYEGNQIIVEDDIGDKGNNSDNSVEIENVEEYHPPIFSFRKLWVFAGPGLLMSIAYLDPGNIESDLQAGAIAGYDLLWVLFLATCGGFILQLLSAKLGVVTGHHLAEICREEYPRPASLTLWIMTEIAIIGADIQEVIGSAIAINALSNNTIPIWGGVLITAADTFTFLFVESAGVRKLEALFASLIAVMAITFGVLFGIATESPDVPLIFRGFIPTLPNKDAVVQAVAIVGAIIMPHNIYLHSALVQSRKINNRTDVNLKEAIKYYGIESGFALTVSFIINFFVVCVFAATFLDPASTCDVDNIGLSSAGECLRDSYNDTVFYIWNVGLLAAGQSSTMTGTYAGQFVMQGFLDLKIAPWKRVLITRTVAILPAVIVATTAIEKIDTVDEWINVIQSVQLPFALIPVLQFTMTSKLMGTFKNSIILNVVCWLLAALVIGINIYNVIIQIGGGQDWFIYLLISIAAIIYFSFLLFLILYNSVWFKNLYSKFFKKNDELEPVREDQPLIN
eukprot:TRINITY_DN919_c0_g1_i1.p1 TRINITY_DN919_c0_g1~~TRINITY_DN919_c0_g1_i1.p1  ORF type:complete len:522 (-),score=238.16 TRINITY_DN919_c0_g1_i1:47-1612(-)